MQVFQKLQKSAGIALHHHKDSSQKDQGHGGSDHSWVPSERDIFTLRKQRGVNLGTCSIHSLVQTVT